MKPATPIKTTSWPKALIRWYQKHRRPMPWGRRITPYRIWVGVTMLQQTRVDQMAPYFRRFMKAFPSVKALAEARADDVLRVWEGLGYYARARRLHAAAKWLHANTKSRLPTSAIAWHRLPGVGEYTAAALASICFGEPVPAVDGNVLRIAARFWGLREDVRCASARQTIARRLADVMRGVNASSFNQGLMELGAVICLPRNPLCIRCPLRPSCVAFYQGHQNRLPRKRRKTTVPHRYVAAAVIWRNGRILITRRRSDQMLGGLWEFPGGKQEQGETLEETARREILEETGLSIRVIRPYLTIRHDYSHLRVTLTAFACQALPGRARPLHVAAVRWVRPDELANYPFPRANRRIAEAVLKEGAP